MAVKIKKSKGVPGAEFDTTNSPTTQRKPTMQFDHSEFSNVESIYTVDEPSGAQLFIQMKNGSLILVAPENDTVSFFRSADDYHHEDGSKPAMFFSADLDAGHHVEKKILVMFDKSEQIEVKSL